MSDQPAQPSEAPRSDAPAPPSREATAGRVERDFGGDSGRDRATGRSAEPRDFTGRQPAQPSEAPRSDAPAPPSREATAGRVERDFGGDSGRDRATGRSAEPRDFTGRQPAANETDRSGADAPPSPESRLAADRTARGLAGEGLNHDQLLSRLTGSHEFSSRPYRRQVLERYFHHANAAFGDRVPTTAETREFVDRYDALVGDHFDSVANRPPADVLDHARASGAAWAEAEAEKWRTGAWRREHDEREHRHALEREAWDARLADATATGDYSEIDGRRFLMEREPAERKRGMQIYRRFIDRDAGKELSEDELRNLMERYGSEAGSIEAPAARMFVHPDNEWMVSRKLFSLSGGLGNEKALYVEEWWIAISPKGRDTIRVTSQAMDGAETAQIAGEGGPPGSRPGPGPGIRSRPLPAPSRREAGRADPGVGPERRRSQSGQSGVDQSAGRPERRRSSSSEIEEVRRGTVAERQRMAPGDELPERVHDVRRQVDAQLSRSTTPSQRLRQALTDRGIAVPPDHDAHHIVPVRGGEKWGERARTVVRQADIHLDSEPNGVPLPRSAETPVAGREALSRHQRIHTTTYYRSLARRLERTLEAHGPDAVRDELRRIRAEIADGSFPH